jgi:hypothetical protein
MLCSLKKFVIEKKDEIKIGMKIEEKAHKIDHGPD